MKVNSQGVGDSQRSVSSSHWRKAQSESGVAKKFTPALPLKAFRMAVRADFIKQMKVARGQRYGEEFETGHYVSIAETFNFVYNCVHNNYY